jgi:hypothetical protein
VGVLSDREGAVMNTETLDKLYLEWSQFTKTRNDRELTISKCAAELSILLDRIQAGEINTLIFLKANLQLRTITNVLE